MPFVTPEQAALLQASTVRLATLAEFHFADGVTRLWNGVGVLDVAGVEWRGYDRWSGLEDLPSLHGTESASITVKITGLDPAHVALARQNVDKVQGRLAYFWLQLFDADWQPVGVRLPAWWGVMQRLVIERSEAGDVSGGAITVGVEIENAYAPRSKTAAGRYTDSEQQYRHPGDRFCRFVSDQQQVTLVWPDY